MLAEAELAALALDEGALNVWLQPSEEKELFLLLLLALSRLSSDFLLEVFLLSRDVQSSAV